ncbi:MAG: response regulator transcription factor [Prolixibacteraceae bacterium]|jgi:two-component system response regulator NreC|nr:response regulator transcription factor [Prolixibacteraceae bacterium]
MINIALFDEHKLILEGFARLVSDVPDFNLVLACDHRNVLTDKLKKVNVHVLILNMHDISVRNLNFIVQLNIDNPKLKILILSAIQNEEIILKTIKAGAKGFLGKDSDINDLKEAVFTLRNGYDYYNKPISNIVVNQYVSAFNSVSGQETGPAQLSARQIEILRLWGEGYSNQEIADQLFISVRTVESHKNHIMQKLNMKSTVDMVKFAIKNNIIDI